MAGKYSSIYSKKKKDKKKNKPINSNDNKGTTGLGKIVGLATGAIGTYKATKSGSANRKLKTAGTLGMASLGAKIGDDAEKYITKKIKKYKKKKKAKSSKKK